MTVWFILSFIIYFLYYDSCLPVCRLPTSFHFLPLSSTSFLILPPCPPSPATHPQLPSPRAPKHYSYEASWLVRDKNSLSIEVCNLPEGGGAERRHGDGLSLHTDDMSLTSFSLSTPLLYPTRWKMCLAIDSYFLRNIWNSFTTIYVHAWFSWFLFSMKEHIFSVLASPRVRRSRNKSPLNLTLSFSSFPLPLFLSGRL